MEHCQRRHLNDHKYKWGIVYFLIGMRQMFKPDVNLRKRVWRG